MRKRRNSLRPWSMNGNHYPDIPDGPTHWEIFLEKEGIGTENIYDNPKVNRFIIENIDRYFIPVRILTMYGFEIDD